MSRIVPFLRHPPAARLYDTTTATTPAAVAFAQYTGVQTTTQCQRQRRRYRTQCSHGGDDIGRRTAVGRKRQSASIEDIFISSLVAAGTCRDHRKSGFGSHGKHHNGLPQSRPYSTSSPARDQAMTMSDGQPEWTREELDDLVEQYDSVAEPISERREFMSPRAARAAHLPLAPRLVLTPEQELLPPQVRPSMPRGKEKEKAGGHGAGKDRLEPDDAEQFLQLKRMLAKPRAEVDLDELWRLYDQLPSRAADLLHPRLRGNLLSLFGLTNSWNTPHAKERYFQLIEDLEAGDIPVNKKQWTTATAFAGRVTPLTTTVQIKGAIETWMRMEDRSHAADHVTFNILFDTAVRARRYALADTIYNEMVSRKMPLDRFFRASVIHCAGIKRDGDAVRKAFRETVEAGEIIDTTLMNAVILAFLRAQEPASAEHVFAKIKRLHESSLKARAPKHWLEEKRLRGVLNQTAQSLRELKTSHEASFFGGPFASQDKREEVQKLTPIEPNATTYAVLIQYHAYTSANIQRIWELLGEMRKRELEVPARVFVYILKGFRTHGGYAFSAWNHHRLEDLWRAMMGHDGTVSQPLSLSPPEDSAYSEPGAKDGKPSERPVGLLPTSINDEDHTQPPVTEDAELTAEAQEELRRAAIAEQEARDLEADLQDRGQYGLLEDDTPTVSAIEEVSEGALSTGYKHQDDVAKDVVFPDDDDHALFPGLDPRPHSMPPLTESVQLSSSTDDVPDTTPPTSLPSIPKAARFSGHDREVNDAETPFLDALDSEAPRVSNSAMDSAHQTSRPLESPPESTLEPSAAAYSPMTASSDEEEVKRMREGYSAAWEKKREETLYDPQPVYRRPFHPPSLATLSDSFPANPEHTSDSTSTSSAEGDTGASSITPEIALAAVRAFYQCCGRRRMLQVWDEISAKWTTGTEEQRTKVSNEVQKLRRHAEIYEGVGR